MTRGFFVTGTDTGVGKTVVSCALVRAMRENNLNIGVMKPIETGVEEAGPLDAQALAKAAANADTLDEICPLQFALPAAPNVAARVEAKAVDLSRVLSSYHHLAARHEWMLVEGAGGLTVPTTDDASMADLASQLQLPLLVVARPALGTINHTRLTLAYARSQGLPVLGVVISHSERITEPDRENLDFLRGELGDALLAEIPFCEPNQEPRLEGFSLEHFLQLLQR